MKTIIKQNVQEMASEAAQRAKNIICFVPDQRKAEAVRDCLEEEITKWHPASISRKHSATYFLYFGK